MGRFNFPSKGLWSVGLDPAVLRLFRDARAVWMERTLRTSLPTGIATWLYGYIRTQTRLIPTPLNQLQSQCGSTAEPKNFRDSLAIALRHLVAEGIIDSGWKFDDVGRLRWMKGPMG